MLQIVLMLVVHALLAMPLLVKVAELVLPVQLGTVVAVLATVALIMALVMTYIADVGVFVVLLTGVAGGEADACFWQVLLLLVGGWFRKMVFGAPWVVVAGCGWLWVVVGGCGRSGWWACCHQTRH